MYGQLSNFYYLNLFAVDPSRSEIELILVRGSGSVTLLAHIVNSYAEGFVATSLARDYGKLGAGLYVATLGKRAVDVEDFRRVLEDSVERYREAVKSKGGVAELGVDNVDVEIVELPATTYVVAQLLNNVVRKIVHKDLLCPRPGEPNSICLSYELLESWVQKGGEDVEQDKWFAYFCKENRDLCGGGDKCGAFFKVVKCLAPRFQHIVRDDGVEMLYLVLHSYYRRISNLELSNILRYIKSQNLGLEVLKNVKVNYRTVDGTYVCDILDIDEEKLELGCGGKEFTINIGNQGYPDEMFKISLNPNYSRSRRFIASYLCKDFERHKDLNRLFPRDYFTILQNDVKIFKRIVGDICISRTCYKIDTEPMKIPAYTI